MKSESACLDGSGRNINLLLKKSHTNMYVPLKEQTAGGALHEPFTSQDMLTVPL